MKIFISEHDRHTSFRAALLNLALLQGITNCEYKTNQELYNEIVLNNSPILPLLDTYLEAYNTWFTFYQEKKAIEQKTGEEYIFSDDEEEELAELMSKRLSALDTLQREYDRLRNR